jgi:hypothetical protein
VLPVASSVSRWRSASSTSGTSRSASARSSSAIASSTPSSPDEHAGDDVVAGGDDVVVVVHVLVSSGGVVASWRRGERPTGCRRRLDAVALRPNGRLRTAGWRPTPAARYPSRSPFVGRRQPGPLAQLAEHRTFNPLVAGSSPARPTKDVTARTCGAAWSARHPVKVEVAGSNPVRSARGRSSVAGRVASLGRVRREVGASAEAAERAPVRPAAAASAAAGSGSSVGRAHD